MVDLEEIGAYWETHPPVHRMMALQMGIKPSAADTEELPEGDDLAELANLFPNGTIK